MSACIPADLQRHVERSHEMDIGGAETVHIRTHAHVVDEDSHFDAPCLELRDHGVQWADVDGDGDEDLSLTGQRPDAMHLVLLNQLEASNRSIKVRVLDKNGRATRAGAEVRVYVAGTRRLLATRLVDTGSGYNAQNDMPVQVGLSSMNAVDVEVRWPADGQQESIVVHNVIPGARASLPLTIRMR